MRTVLFLAIICVVLVTGDDRHGHEKRQGYIPEPPGSTQCSQWTNVPGQGPYDDPRCYGNTLSPYCSEGSDSNAYCHPCNPYRNVDWECDCPPNYYCRPFLGRPDNVYANGYCTPFDQATKACFTTLDCDTYTYGFLTLETLRLGRFSCVNGFCRPCNQSYWGAGVVKNCTAWNHVTQTGSSRPGETRECAATGYLIGGGALATTAPPPTTTAPPSVTTVTTKPSTTGSGPTTSSSAMHYASIAIVLGSLLSLVSM